MPKETLKPAPLPPVPFLPKDPRASFDPLRSHLQDPALAFRNTTETEVDFEGLVRQRVRDEGKRLREAQAAGPVPDVEIPVSYTLDRLIGKGGFGEVWEGIQTNFGRRIAVKRLRSDLRQRTESAAATGELYELTFRQEALTAGALEHPNIIPVYAYGTDTKGSPVLAMKLIRGRPWGEVIDEDWDRMAPHDFLGRHLPILIDMAQAVAFAHSRGIIHRDLKPSQVMVGEFGEVLLADWGLAVAHDREALRRECAGYSALAVPTTDTATNPAGTVAYMAPEQTLPTASKLGTWTDVFLLGGTLYYLLTRTPPWDATISVAAFADAIRCEVVPPELRCPQREIPRELSDLVMQAMAKEPAHRVPTASAFIDALRDYLTGSGRRRESMALVREGTALLAEAGNSYQRLGETLTTAERAYGLWPENRAADELRTRANAQCVRTAIENRDLVLARAHAERLPLGEQRSIYLAEIAALEEEQLLQQQALKTAYGHVRERSARAEDLMSFMLTDLFEGLKPIGRLDLLDKVVRKALDHFAAIPDEDQSEGDLRNRSRALCSLAEVQRERGDLTGARETCERALALFGHFACEESATRRELGMTQSRLGDVLRAQGDIDGSLSAYRAALTLMEETAGDEGADWRSKRDVFVIRERLGFLSELKGDLDGALVEYTHSRRIAEDLLARDPNTPSRRQDLSFALNRVGDVLRTRGDFASAVEACAEARAIRRELAQLAPESVGALRDLSVSSMLVGDLHVQLEEFGRALECYEEALGITETLAKRDPANAARQSDYGLALGNVAEMMRIEGRLDSAKERHAAGLAIHERLAQRDPSNTFHQFAIAWTRLGLGKVFAALQDQRAARAHWETVVRVLEPVTRTNRGASNLDSIAQALLLLGRNDEARPHVEELLRRGWRDREFIALARKAGFQVKAG